MTVLRSGSATDVGRVRVINEDFHVESMSLFAVADGMGGHAGGEVAARTAIEALSSAFTLDSTAEGLLGAVRAANRAVLEKSLGEPELFGMGTTLTVAALVETGEGDRLVIANVGDSRAYRLHDGALDQLTVDHSVAEELVARGELTEAEAAVHPHRHILTRALGIEGEVAVDARLLVPEEGDRYLLCSDGLSNELSPDRISGVLSATEDPQVAAASLVRLANEHGGADNITVVVLDVLVADGQDAAGTLAPGTLAPEVFLVPRETPGEEPSSGASFEAPSALQEVTGFPPRAELTVAADPAAGQALEYPAGPPSDGMPSLRLDGPRLPGGDVEPHEARAKPRRRRAPRPWTLRALVFVVLFLAVFAAGWEAIRYYADHTWFVGLSDGQVAVFRGRPGGFLWYDPVVVQRTGITSSEVPPDRAGDLSRGLEEPSLAAASQYVRNLRQQIASIRSAGGLPPTTTAPSHGGASSPSALARPGQAGATGERKA
jgi:protein phosphatase